MCTVYGTGADKMNMNTYTSLLSVSRCSGGRRFQSVFYNLRSTVHVY